MTRAPAALAALLLTALTACARPSGDGPPRDAAGPSAHGPAASPGGRPPLGGGTGTVTTAGVRPLLAAVTDPAAFEAAYSVRGRLTVRSGGTKTSLAPATLRSTWDGARTTVRGRTPYGAVGFAFGYTDDGFRLLDHLTLYVPAPGATDEVAELPLAAPLPWLIADVGVPLASATDDRRWDVALLWADDRTLTVTVTPRGDPGAYLTGGTLTLRLDGTPSNPWRGLRLGMDMRTDSGVLSGALTAVRR